MMEPQTISEVMALLYKQGYTETFRADENGMQASSGKTIRPEDLSVDKTYRFEGETDINEEAIIFALSSKRHSLRGTYLVAFGPLMDPLDCDVVHRLTPQ
jgi:hypothetical protein